MSDIRINNLTFDRGIDTITYAREEAASAMPERGDAAPPDIGMRGQLDTLLQQQSMDDTLDWALRPQLDNRDLSRPGKFREALGNALAQFRTAAAGAGDGSEPSLVFNRAVRLLGEESHLRELVQMYRSTLYQG